jgi:hypothetical protein
MERKNIHISNLELDDNQSRVDSSVDESFVESIENVGILQNLVVREGDDGYKIIAGARRYRGAMQANVSELPCSVIEANDEEATRASIVENTQREDLTQFETVRSVRMWYDVLCKDLPQANEDGEFESPIEEGKTFDSRQGLKTHIQMDKGSTNSVDPLINKEDVIKRISEQSPYSETTTRDLIRLGKLPHKILILLKTEEERTGDEQDIVETRFKSDYSFGGDKSTAVNTKFLEIDKLLRNASEDGLTEEQYPEFVYTVLERRNINSDTTLLNIRSEFNDVIQKYSGWKGEVIEKARIEKAAMGEEPPEEDSEEEQDKSIDRTDDKKEQSSWTNEDSSSSEITDGVDEEGGDGESSDSVDIDTSKKQTGSQDKNTTSWSSKERDKKHSKEKTKEESQENQEVSTKEKDISGEFVLKCFGERVNRVDLEPLKELVQRSDFTPEEAVREAEIKYINE